MEVIDESVVFLKEKTAAEVAMEHEETPASKTADQIFGSASAEILAAQAALKAKDGGGSGAAQPQTEKPSDFKSRMRIDGRERRVTNGV